MKRFANLLEALVFTPSRNAKLSLLEHYFRTTPDPDRGWALASLTGNLELRTASPSLIKGLVKDRVDPTLFQLSYDFVGDLAETASLIWEAPTEKQADRADLPLSEVVDDLRNANKRKTAELLSGWMDMLPPSQRFALLKLAMGGLRVGVSARLARTALARLNGTNVAQIEEIWFGLTPPYMELFSWLEGKSGKPEIDDSDVFHPMMLANPLDENSLTEWKPEEFVAEWKWDGIRVQLNARGDAANLFSRTGENIGASFPDITSDTPFDAVIDGELLVMKDGNVASFNDLQQRLGRKTVARRTLEESPAHIRAYDILFLNGEDLRSLALSERRAILEKWYDRTQPDRIDLSPAIPFDTWEKLIELRATLRTAGIEGLMLKRLDSPYIAGRPKGPWFKWKRDPYLADCVLMYAQRGHGKRSSLYSDFTFGCWRSGDEGDELVPVGKAYSGFTDLELQQLDKWVRAHGTDRYGPVRAVEYGLVFEVAFDAVHTSKRHKSGVAMRFPRIHRIRWDKPFTEADRVETLSAMIET